MTIESGGWVTMGEVAEKAGVSKITVSRVLRTPDKVREETRERVRAAIAELGYVPDEAAGGLSSRRSRIVGAVISTLAGSTFASTVDGLGARLRQNDHQLLLAGTDYSSAKEAEAVGAMLGRRPDGLVLTSTAHTANARQTLAASRIPVVELWELPVDPIGYAVGFSNRDAGAAMARHLLATGRRRMAFIGTSGEGDRRGRLRYEGFAEILADSGLAEARATAASSGTQTARGARGLAAVLERWPDTDAVFCSSDALALGALSEAGRRGLRVPDDLAIAGFGDFEFAGEFGLGLTTVRIPGLRIGETAAQLILDVNAGIEPASRTVDLGFEVIDRSTT
ncbi:LacI family DNA-binding transcriptional regulator [Thalassobaculum sp. OXR-137]|uniref:LacI family DNA-binding transcriptional regulator n=1 Tax=Thalassobaculum sp. OXR-137 TaxID=3100173 RepID=UPI002AC990F3|nr:LacI family DNA-binding transcriptional regulator [Thalassobaculum sp. OXR-137]WPZ34706.1 LacI family DNA-binding transcriptional regulator [Thalassobaculum sp. OXR-137]